MLWDTLYNLHNTTAAYTVVGEPLGVGHEVTGYYTHADEHWYRKNARYLEPDFTRNCLVMGNILLSLLDDMGTMAEVSAWMYRMCCEILYSECPSGYGVAEAKCMALLLSTVPHLESVPVTTSMGAVDAYYVWEKALTDSMRL